MMVSYVFCAREYTTRPGFGCSERNIETIRSKPVETRTPVFGWILNDLEAELGVSFGDGCGLLVTLFQTGTRKGGKGGKGGTAGFSTFATFK
jgi:hypothetical protein